MDIKLIFTILISTLLMSCSKNNIETQRKTFLKDSVVWSGNKVTVNKCRLFSGKEVDKKIKSEFIDEAKAVAIESFRTQVESSILNDITCKTDFSNKDECINFSEKSIKSFSEGTLAKSTHVFDLLDHNILCVKLSSSYIPQEDIFEENRLKINPGDIVSFDTIDYKYNTNIDNELLLVEMGQKLYGEGNYPHALFYFKKAALMNNALAQSYVGLFIHSGYGVKVDYKKAFYWFEKAAKQGLPLGNLGLAVMYLKGQHIEQNTTTAISLLKKASLIQPDLNCTAGYLFDSETGLPNRYEIAFDFFKQGALKSEPKCQNALGDYYNYFSKGIGRDVVKAAKWHEKAAIQGLAEAQYNMGAHYYMDEGVDYDIKKAYYWIKKAADQNYLSAIHHLAVFYQSGRVVNKDLEMTKKLWMKAARLGHQLSIEHLKLYFNITDITDKK
jgi:uncharacterized protein